MIQYQHNQVCADAEKVLEASQGQTGSWYRVGLHMWLCHLACVKIDVLKNHIAGPRDTWLSGGNIPPSIFSEMRNHLNTTVSYRLRGRERGHESSVSFSVVPNMIIWPGHILKLKKDQTICEAAPGTLAVVLPVGYDNEIGNLIQDDGG